MSAEQQMKKEIIEAVVFLREHNHTIPSETIEFMKQASLDKLKKRSVTTFCFDCWDRNGNTDTKVVDAVTVEDAKAIFKERHPNFAFDEPYV